MNKITVTKRDGSPQGLDLSQVERSVSKACQGLESVSPLLIVVNAQVKFEDGIKTRDIAKALISSAKELIQEDTDYAKAAGRLLSQDLRKSVYGQYEPWSWLEQVKRCVSLGFYDKQLLEGFTEAELIEIGSYIDHTRDDNFEVGGLEQTQSKYLMKNRADGKLLETPQMAYMRVAVTAYSDNTMPSTGYDWPTRLSYIVDYYKILSEWGVTKPTPIMGGAGSPTRQGSSCVGIAIDDDLESIAEGGSAIMRYSGKRAGIGFDVSRLRPEGSPIRNGEMLSTGLVPFIKKLRGDLKSCAQGGIRGAAGTCFINALSPEIRSLLVLKNSKGTEDSRERKLDYGVQLNGYIWDRIIRGENLYLFDPHARLDLYNAFFRGDLTEFVELYEDYSRGPIDSKWVINGDELGHLIMGERSDTGRIFPLFVDNMNAQGPFEEDLITHSNLCMEIALPSKPFFSREDWNGRVFLCTLSNLNWGAYDSPEQMRRACHLVVRYLDTFLDYQDYPQLQAKLSTEEYRPLGVGIINLAYFLAKRGMKYGDDAAVAEVKRWAEHMAYYLTEGSVILAEERGPAPGIGKTCYGKGRFPWEKRKPGADAVTSFAPELDWETLRARMIAAGGTRNATLMAQPPAETSSQPAGATNGVEPPFDLISIKSSKDGSMIHVVPGYKLYKGNYETKFAMGQDGTLRYLRTLVPVQVYFCQSISANTFYNPHDFPNGRLPYNKLMADVTFFYNAGGKGLYYHLNFDGDASVREDAEAAEDCEACKA